MRILSKKEIYYGFADENIIFLHNPYGPLYFYVSAIFAKFFKNIFFAGRLVSFLSYISIIVVLYLIFARQSFLRFLFAASLFAGSPIVWKSSTIARVDFFALALTAYALYFLYIAENEDSLRDEKILFKRIIFADWGLLFLSGFLSLLAVLVKPIYFISMLTGFIFLRNFSFIRFAMFAAGVFTVFVIFVFWILASSQFALFYHWTSLNMIGFSFANFAKLLLIFLRNHLLHVLFLIFSIYGLRRERIFWYFTLFSTVMIIFALKEGAGENYFLPSLLSSSIAFAKFAEKFEGIANNYFVYASLALQLGIFLPISSKAVFGATYGFETPAAALTLSPCEDDIALGKALLGEIVGSSGAVLCDEPGYLLLSGKEIIVQPYQYGKLVERKNLHIQPLKKKIDDGFFSLFVIRSAGNQNSTSYFPREIIALIKEKYSLRGKIGNYEIYE